MTNRLTGETSPYLLQHADNPVDWYPWGPEALARARDDDKPILLSVGYSACHWCHVMAHECFENDEIAHLMNETFVNIKVDREERPDIDAIYMGAVQAMTGSGGWPLTAFLTPEGKPFFGGTYFPPEDRHGRPGFPRILRAVADAYHHRRTDVEQTATQLLTALSRDAHSDAGSEPLTVNTLGEACLVLHHSLDRENGGFGTAPKFPQPMALEFLLRYFHRPQERAALEMAELTLEKMARGGICDQIGGGFHRYATDAHWMVPHFEKMLYDNAQLARVYLHAWQVSGNPFYRTIAEETLDYVVREMTDPQGGFYSSQDADSEGEEGKFFVWTADEVRAVLGDQAAHFLAACNVTERGNFEGKNVLAFAGRPEERDALAEARRKLFTAREQRRHPGRDDKVLTAWNGLMLAAFAEAARVLNRDDYRQIAQHNADFLLRELRREDGRLYRSWKEVPVKDLRPAKARINGYLEDYTHLIEGLLELYQTTFDPRWYQAARELAETMIEHYSTPDGGFFDTGDDHEPLITRPRGLQDNAIPSGNAMATFVLLRLSGLSGEPRYTELARHSLRQMQPLLTQYPPGFGQWLVALDYALAHPCGIAIVGDPAKADTRALLEVCTTGYRPYQIVALGDPNAEDPVVPLLQGLNQIEGRATAYVCVDFACRPPVTAPDELQALLE